MKNYNIPRMTAQDFIDFSKEDIKELKKEDRKTFIKKTGKEVSRRLKNLKRGNKTKTVGGRGGGINQQRAIKDLWKL